MPDTEKQNQKPAENADNPNAASGRHGKPHHGQNRHGRNRPAQNPTGEKPQNPGGEKPQNQNGEKPQNNARERSRNRSQNRSQNRQETPAGKEEKREPSAAENRGGRGSNQNRGGQNRRGQKPQNPEAAANERGEQNGQNPNGSRRNRGEGQGQRRDRRGRDRRDQTAAQDVRESEPKELAETALPASLRTDDFFAPARTDSFLGLSKEDESLIDSMPPDPTLDAVFADPQPAPEEPDGVEIVGIHFPQGGKVYYFDPAGHTFPEGSMAIVETARGQELGEVAVANRKVPESAIVQPLKQVIRPAGKEDLEHHKANAVKEAEALEICKKKVLAHKLDMKLTGAQYTFDNAKLIFYFTAAQRVDFRELVKDLAVTFRTRIELRQIGSRDEAKMVGGQGVCGRKLCCSAFLPNYAQVSIKMAKHQGLALNSAKISGNCGRLMCCLKFEESTYERELALMPTVNSVVETPDGRGRVTDVRPVGYTVKVKLDGQPDAAPKPFKLEEIRTLVRAEAAADDDGDDRGEDSGN